MNSFHLTIVTPTGSEYEGMANRVTVRTTNGAVSILAKHINYVAALGIGPAEVELDGQIRKAACVGGMIAVTNGQVKVIASSFLWKDEIDVERAKNALSRADEKLSSPGLSFEEIDAFKAAKKRAETRIQIANS